MAVNLKKGGRVDLTKDTGLLKALLGLGWDTNRYDGGKDFDLDLVLFMCDGNGRCTNEKQFVYFGNTKDPDESVIHSGDNRTGAGDGDDETAIIDFSKIPANIEKIVVAVTIYEAKERNQNFGSVDNSYIRVLNHETGEVLARYDLGEDFSTETSVVFGELYKHNGEWKFKAVGQGYEKELADLCVEYGLTVA